MMRKRSSSTGKAGRMDAPPTESSVRHGEALQAKNHKLAKELVSCFAAVAASAVYTGRIETTVYVVHDNVLSLSPQRNVL
jgi:hypothetical protein